MKTRLIALIMILFGSNIQAQTNFYEMIDSLYAADSAFYNVADSLKTAEHKRLERMKTIWGPRLSPHGNAAIASQSIVNNAITQAQEGVPESCAPLGVTWTEIGPFDEVGFQRGNNGQINRIAVDPGYDGVSNKRIYAGSFYGGLYRSLDGGENWTNLNTDQGLPQTSVSGIAVSYQNNNKIFICTGMGDTPILDFTNGGATTNGRSTPITTSGVYRSLNDGSTWQLMDPSMLTTYFVNGGSCRDIKVDPTNEDYVFTATSEGLFRSQNATQPNPTFSKINFSSLAGITSGDFSGLEFQPITGSGQSSRLYAASNQIVYSDDQGVTWTQLTGTGINQLDISTLNGGNYDLKRIKLAVTPANRNLLFAYLNGQDNILGEDRVYIYKYDFVSSSWNQITSDNGLIHPPPGVARKYPSDWMGLAIAPDNENSIYFSGISVKGNIHPITRQTMTNFIYMGLTHDDIHDIEFLPAMNGDTCKAIFATHGGIAIETYGEINNTGTYALGAKPKNKGINTSMIWGFDVSKINEQEIVIARQDNGSHLRSSVNNWIRQGSGDGYAAMILDEENSLKTFVSQNGWARFNGAPISRPIMATDVASNPGITLGREQVFPNMAKAKRNPKTGLDILGFCELYNFNPDGINQNQKYTIQSDMFNNNFYGWHLFTRIVDFDISASEPDNVYIAVTGGDLKSNLPIGDYYSNRTNLFVSNNVSGGLTNGTYPTSSNKHFTERTAWLPQVADPVTGVLYPVYITGIETHPTDPLKVYISVSGFHAGKKVYESADGGQNWTNISGNCLPNLPANDIFYQEGSLDRLYLAMDDGVYVKEGTSDWKKLTGLPNVKVFELVPHYCSNQLFVGTYGRGIWSTQLLPRDDNGTSSELVIDQNTTWSSNRIMESDILVETGNKLTITATVYMPVGGTIKIQPGAELHVDGGTIKNNCGVMWNGIEVQGDNSKAQNSNDQGLLRLTNGATLEFAEEAIQVMETGTWNTFGGMVYANNANFKNCKRAASFMTYNSPNGVSNTSSFEKCTFELDGDFPQGLTPLSQVTIWDNDGIEFLGCEFVDNRPDADHEFNTSIGNGIFSLDAGYYVGPYCDMLAPQSPCPSEYVLRSSFKRFNHGILAEGAATSATLVVDQTDFEDNSIATQIQVFDQVRFTRNSIKVGKLLKTNFSSTANTSYLHGFRSFDSQGYEIEENVFEQNGSNVSNGINIIKSDYQNNRTYRNDFKGMEVAQLAEGMNLDPSNKSIGLQFLCNTNSITNEFDIVVNDGTASSNGGVRQRQGRKKQSAGNIVSLNPTNPEGHFQNNALNNPTLYWYYSAAENPQNHSAGLVLPNLALSANNCPVNYQTINPGGGVEMPENAHQNYYSELAQYYSVLYAYHQNIDNGNTDSLVQAINMTISNEAQNLRDALMAESPYLSTDALMSAAETGILTDALLLEICLANPEATMSEGFLDFVEFEIPNTLSATMVQLIYQNWDVESPRGILEDQLAEHSETVDLLANQILRHYQTDTLSHQDSIFSMHESRNRLTSKYRLIELNLEIGDWEACSSLFNELDQNIELAEWQIAEHNNFKAYVAFRQAISNNGKTYMQLNESELDALRSIANNRTGRSSDMAQNILCFGYHECFIGSASPELRSKRNRVYDMNATDENLLIAHPSIVLQPNPVQDILQVRLRGFDFEQKQITLQVFSIEGKLLLNEQVNQKLNHINIRNFENGTYLYRLFEGDKQLQEGKVIVLH